MRKKKERKRAEGDVELGGGASLPARPPAVRDRAKQTVNYPDNTGEGGKRRVNETLISLDLTPLAPSSPEVSSRTAAPSLLLPSTVAHMTQGAP